MTSISGGNSSTQEGTKVSGRTGHVPFTRLWMDDEGNPIPVTYAFHPINVISEVKQNYEAQVKLWSDQTCLKFQEKKLESSMTERDVKKWCYVDKVKRKEDKVSFVTYNRGGYAPYGISPDGVRCETFRHMPVDRIWTNRLLFSFTLGLVELFNRPDSGKFVGLNFEHFGKISDRRYLNNIMRCRGKAIPMPIPFDYMSVQMMESNWYGTKEATPVIVTLDPSQQYLLDYRFRGQLPASFFDILTINMLYKCIPKWENSCKASGKEVPKCKNYGFVTKDCTCRCSPSFSGETCEQKTGNNFPYPMQDGAFTLAIIDDKSYDLGKLLPIKTASLSAAHEDLKYNVFINVKIAPKDPTRLPTIKVFLPFKNVGDLLEGRVDKFVEGISSLDCTKGMRLLWGNSKVDGRRLACECTSMLASNEPLENSRVIRGREPNMTVTLINQLGLEFKSEKLTVESSKLILVTMFLPPPKLLQEQNSTSPPAHKSGTSAGKGNDTASALTVAGSSGTMAFVVAAGAGLALLLVLCLLLFLIKRRKKKRQEDLQAEEEEDDDSTSDSDYES